MKLSEELLALKKAQEAFKECGKLEKASKVKKKLNEEKLLRQEFADSVSVLSSPSPIHDVGQHDGSPELDTPSSSASSLRNRRRQNSEADPISSAIIVLSQNQLKAQELQVQLAKDQLQSSIDQARETRTHQLELTKTIANVLLEITKVLAPQTRSGGPASDN